jgi:hypothetical protein
MRYLEGFTWPVPIAFASAVAACRFEQGDVLYDDPAAYDAWEGKDAAPGTVIQVIDPPKTARAPSGDAEGNRFQVNWGLPVVLDVYVDGAPTPDRRATTQGRLFCCLWQGDPALLDDDSPLPEPPLGQRELQRRLEEAVPAFVRAFRKRTAAGGHSLLILAVDDASDAARVKAHAIEALLAEAFEVEGRTLAPAQAGLEEPERLHPALGLRGIAIAQADASAIESQLAPLLYGGADASAGRFSLARHGHLAPLAKP